MKNNFSHYIYVIDDSYNVLGTVRAYMSVSKKATNELELILCSKDLLNLSKQSLTYKSLTLFIPDKNSINSYKECILKSSGSFINMEYEYSRYGTDVYSRLRKTTKYISLCKIYDREEKLEKIIGKI